MASKNYSNLFSPITIGELELKNRIIVTAMGVNLAEEDGRAGDRFRKFHETHAQGGAAMVITGATGVAWPVGSVQPGQVAISDDKYIPDLTRLADALHTHGCKLCVQLHHGGAVAAGEAMRSGDPLWVPSHPEPPKGNFTDDMLLEELAEAGKGVKHQPTYKVMTQDDINTVVRQFADAAKRVQQAGADAIEIHAGHGYLLSSFISPRANKRTDEYGGSVENRARLLLEIIAAIRAEVGDHFCILCKLDSREVGVSEGITLETAAQTAQLAENAGVNAITVSAYHDTGQGKLHSASNIPHIPETNLPAAQFIKEAVKLPIIASGRVEPDSADRHIGSGHFDCLAMGRKLLADPELPNKLKSGRTDQIRPCIYCYTCVSAIYTREPVRCAVNAKTGLEYRHRELPTDQHRRVVIVGGGPGGMEAARLLAESGNQVTILEQGAQLGGTLQFASLAYPANEPLLDWLRQQVRALPIEVRLNTPATTEYIQSLKPDAVIVATGAERKMPAITGADQKHVFSGDDMRRMMLGQSSSEIARKVGPLSRTVTKIGALTGLTRKPSIVRKASHWWMPLKKRIGIIGGDLVGLELAEFLNERGRQVTVIDETERMGKGLTLVRRMRLLAELREHGVDLYPSASDIRITEDTIQFLDSADKNQQVPIDHVIVAKGASSDLSLAETLSKAGLEVLTVGDCNGVGYIEGAIRGATEAVTKILTEADNTEHAEEA